MAEITEDELENLLKDFPSHKNYEKLNRSIQHVSRLAGHCDNMKKFNNRDYDMKNLCKRIAWNLDNLYNILPYTDSKVRCSYFNHWIYNEIRKLLVTEYNFKKDESAVFKLLDLGSDMNRNLRINRCSFELYTNHDFHEWKEMKDLHDYFKNYTTLKSKIVSDYDKCNLYSKYIKYILKIYDTHKYDCCDSDWPYDSDCPKYFKCHGYYNPESLLSLLRCNDTSLGAHVLERVPEEPKFREESRERFRPQIQNRSGSFPDIEVREIKENGFQNPVVPEIMRVKGPQFPTEAALRRRLDTSRSEVDGSEGNLGSRNRRLMQTTRAPSQEYLGEGIRKEVDYKPAVTEITHVQYTEKEDEKVTSEGGISYQLTSGPYSELGSTTYSYTPYRRHLETEDRGTFSAYNGESEIYTSGGGSYTEMSEYGGDEHTTSGGFSSHFSNILELLKNNVYTVSIGSVASVGFLYFFYNYFKSKSKSRRENRRQRMTYNNNFYLDEEEYPELSGYSSNFDYSNPYNRDVHIFYNNA
ncbi:VIR protein [Plasmodium vivax]|uniref:VIR protein n=1 Tax=Plasmodium vivax TaxID=5855 RepID=A0A1G4HFZ8_PLAVI|nr:VIR protein [Plasmodium vivax]